MFGAESRTPSDQSRVAPEESVHVTEAKYDWYLPLQAVEPEYLLPENEQNRLHDYHIEARDFWSGRRESNPRIELGKLSFSIELRPRRGARSIIALTHPVTSLPDADWR